MIKLRVTDLDAWRDFVEPELPEFEISTEQFLAKMRRLVPPTDEMRAGHAFHCFMEKAKVGVFTEAVQDHFVFKFECETRLTLPRNREASIERVYHMPSGNVLLRGKVDAATDLEVIDYKLTLSSFDAERYAESLQWRAYLDMMGRKKFRYLVFQGKQATRGGNRVGSIRIVDVHELTFWAYPEMTIDVQRRVAELAEFVKIHLPEMVVA